MLVFNFNHTEKQLELACNEFSEIQLVADNEVCKGWDMRLGHSELNITKYGDFYRVGDCYNGKILRSFKCSFDGNMITIYSANDNGRELKAEKYLKKYAQCAMRVFALVKCGKIN
jgi:hypothetical protein